MEFTVFSEIKNPDQDSHSSWTLLKSAFMNINLEALLNGSHIISRVDGMEWIMGNQSRPQEGDGMGGMSGKGMQVGKDGRVKVAARTNGTAAFINLWISGRVERTERWTERGRIPQDG